MKYDPMTGQRTKPGPCSGLCKMAHDTWQMVMGISSILIGMMAVAALGIAIFLLNSKFNDASIHDIPDGPATNGNFNLRNFNGVKTWRNDTTPNPSQSITDWWVMSTTNLSDPQWAGLSTTQITFGVNTTFNGAVIVPNGVAVKSGASTWGTYSDARLKENIEAVDPNDSARLIQAVNIKTFNYLQSPDRPEIGVIAQELATPCPECITQTPYPAWKDAAGVLHAGLPDGLAVDHHILNVHSLNALKFALGQIADLKAKVNALATAAA